MFNYFKFRENIVNYLRRSPLSSTTCKDKVIIENLETLRQVLFPIAKVGKDTLLKTLGTTYDGLTEDEAKNIRMQVGLNEIEQKKQILWWLNLWYCYKNPSNYLLTLLAIISFFTKDIKSAIVISMMIILATLLRFWQAEKSYKAAGAIKSMFSNIATVIRRDYISYPQESRRIDIPINQLVPGDIIALSAGDMIPADCRILKAKDLFVSQASMTGESIPIEKFLEQSSSETVNILELKNILFMGTSVVSGSALAVIVLTGKNTYFGKIANQVIASQNVVTPFQKTFQTGINKVSLLLINLVLIISPLVFIINGLTTGNWRQALLFSLAIAVGITPEMLPMIVASTLAEGAILLSRKKVIVKRIEAMHNFGAMDILCTDKTGTLTQNKILLAQHIDAWGVESDEVLKMAYLNSYYQTGLKNLLDVAVLEHSDAEDVVNLLPNFSKFDEIPFDFNRRRMSVVVAEQNNHYLLITKGAIEEVLAVCVNVRDGEMVKPLSKDLYNQITSLTSKLNNDGLRVMAVATKEFLLTQSTYSIKDESGLTLIGYIAFLDPPKDSAAPALKALGKLGITVKVLSGDNDLVTAKICREVGFPPQGMLRGADIDLMSDIALAKVVETTNIFAKLNPFHKERIVRLLKANGHMVGFIGDGINDVTALRTADVGISVDTAVDVAKESADILLLEKSLMVLVDGVLEGRRAFVNMIKYVKITACSNFGNVLSVLIASIILPFLPMLPIHLLVQNLLYDISQIAIPFDNVDEDMVAKSQQWHPKDILRFIVFFGPVSSIFDIMTFAIMWFVFNANTIEQQTLFQSGWFIVGLLTQVLVVHMIRTPKIPFIESRASTHLMIMTCFIIAIGIFLPMGAFAAFFKFQALPILYFLFLPLIVVGYMGLMQMTKGIYIRRFGWQ